MIAGWGVGFPAVSISSKDALGWLATALTSELPPGAVGASCPDVPRQAGLYAEHLTHIILLTLLNP